MTIKSGFVNIIKPTGVSSFKVVSEIKNALKIKKVGHLGTLDPAASGVLPIAFGKATKFFEYFLNKNKKYVAVVQFGVLTDTLDSFGAKKEEQSVKIDRNKIENAIKKFIGKIEQVPPSFSAIKVDGQRAYDLARAGIDVKLKPREIEIYSIKVLDDLATNRFRFEVYCSAGTYIRTLFNDIAKELGTVATTTVIIRTESGPFKIDDAITIDEFKLSHKTISVDEILSDLKQYEIKDKQIAEKVINGVKLNNSEIDGCNAKSSFILKYNGQIIGIYHIEKGRVLCDIFIWE